LALHAGCGVGDAVVFGAVLDERHAELGNQLRPRPTAKQGGRYEGLGMKGRAKAKKEQKERRSNAHEQVEFSLSDKSKISQPDTTCPAHTGYYRNGLLNR
jgi:hypothetical protein